MGMQKTFNAHVFITDGATHADNNSYSGERLLEWKQYEPINGSTTTGWALCLQRRTSEFGKYQTENKTIIDSETFKTATLETDHYKTDPCPWACLKFTDSKTGSTWMLSTPVDRAHQLAVALDTIVALSRLHKQESQCNIRSEMQRLNEEKNKECIRERKRSQAIGNMYEAVKQQM